MERRPAGKKPSRRVPRDYLAMLPRGHYLALVRAAERGGSAAAARSLRQALLLHGEPVIPPPTSIELLLSAEEEREWKGLERWNVAWGPGHRFHLTRLSQSSTLPCMNRVMPQRSRMPYVLLVLAAALAFSASPAWAGHPAQQGGPIIIYFFWGDGCPHCAAAEPFLADLAARYPNVEIRDYEVWKHPENRESLIRMAAKFGFEPTAVPTIFLGERYWVGFAAGTIGAEIAATVAACAQSGCPDAGSGVLTPAAGATPAAAPTPQPSATAPAGAAPAEPPPAAVAPSQPAPAAGSLTLPLIGTVDLATQSLALSTALIAFVDGFNPCSLWVLSVLLALTLHTGSRRKVFIIGLVFLTVTSLVYALFIAGLFTMFTVVSFAPWIRVVIALVALFFAVVNIKDYFWYKEGISFTIADEKKPGLYRSMRRVLNAGDSMPALIGATIVMSAGASLVEFSCTAGFPVLWTNLLAAQGVAALTFVALLGLYMVIYQIDELAIFMAAVVSLRASRLEEKHGRILKLFGGALMLALAIVMLVNPSLMSRVTTSLLVFAAAFAAAGLVLAVHRLLLPRFGIVIGTEFPRREGAAQ